MPSDPVSVPLTLPWTLWAFPANTTPQESPAAGLPLEAQHVEAIAAHQTERLTVERDAAAQALAAVQLELARAQRDLDTQREKFERQIEEMNQRQQLAASHQQRR